MQSLEVDRKSGKLRKHQTVIPLPCPVKQKPSLNESQEYQREDGRPLNQFRRIFVKTGVSGHANGSAYIEMEQTKVLCTVFGPREATKTEFRDKARLNCDFKFASFAIPNSPKGFIPDSEEKHKAMIMREALESSIQLHKYPKTSIDVYILVLQEDGGAVPAAINAASLALADAGIEMYDIVCACSIAFCSSSLILDPTIREQEISQGHMMLGYLPHLCEISHILHSSGEISAQSFAEAMEMCVDGCGKLRSLMKDCLQQRFQSSSLSLQSSDQT